jgi:hypothetical protein
MTANQAFKNYRKSGGTLPFAQWMDREKRKGFLNAIGSVPTNRPLTDSIQQTLDEMHREGGYQDTASNDYILGVNKWIWIGLGVTAAAVIGFTVYQKMKK